MLRKDYNKLKNLINNKMIRMMIKIHKIKDIDKYQNIYHNLKIRNKKLLQKKLQKQ